MKKIKYQGGITKLIASKIGKRNRDRFVKSILNETALKNIYSEVKNPKTIDWDIVSFSSANDFAEQVLSILSFVRYVGVPTSWTIYSDGSHTDEHINLLKHDMPFVHVIKVNLDELGTNKSNLKESLQHGIENLLDYAMKFPLGKKLLFYLNHSISRATLFIDSDILFYNKSSTFFERLDLSKNGYFLPEAEWGCLDSRYKSKIQPQLYQVNAGFLFLSKEFCFIDKALDLVKAYGNTYEYFSEQTIFHLLALENDFCPLDPRLFIIDNLDQFDFSYRYHPQYIAIRHYTGPVRHKMWQRDWKWHLSIS